MDINKMLKGNSSKRILERCMGKSEQRKFNAGGFGHKKHFEANTDDNHTCLDCNKQMIYRPRNTEWHCTHCGKRSQ